MTVRPARPSSGRRPAELSRDFIVNAALTFLDRDGWDALTINALATQLGTKGPSLRPPPSRPVLRLHPAAPRR